MGLCWSYLKDKSCKFGDKCKFEHRDPDKVVAHLSRNVSRRQATRSKQHSDSSDTEPDIDWSAESSDEPESRRRPSKAELRAYEAGLNRKPLKSQNRRHHSGKEGKPKNSRSHSSGRDTHKTLRTIRTTSEALTLSGLRRQNLIRRF